MLYIEKLFNIVSRAISVPKFGTVLKGKIDGEIVDKYHDPQAIITKSLNSNP